MITTTNSATVMTSYGPGRPQFPYPGGPVPVPYPGGGNGPRPFPSPYPSPYPTPYPSPYPSPYNPAPRYPFPHYPAPYPPYNPAPQYPMPHYPAPYPPYNPAPRYPAPNYPTPNYPTPNYPAPNYPAPQRPEPNYPAPNYPAPNNPAPVPSYPSPSQPVPGSGRVPASIRTDLGRASSKLQQSLGILASLPANDRGDESTADARRTAFHMNLDAQHLLESHFNARDTTIGMTLRTADERLQEAAWQMAKTPSPDGRFNGVNLPGAIAATNAAFALINQVLSAG